MRLTAKKISELTAVPAANIRKWRERYGILDPERGENGYLYYTSEDYRVVLSISRMLSEGKKLSAIMQLGREKLLAVAPKTDFSEDEMRLLEQVIEGNFGDLGRELNNTLRLHKVEHVIVKRVWPLTILIGRAWESGFITVATEHSFTRWMMGYLSQLALTFNRKQDAGRLFVAFPGDEHELGAMMHYVLMSVQGHGGKFSGALPLDKLHEELGQGDYDEVHVSATMPKARVEIDRFVSNVHRRFPRVKVKIGGLGAKIAEGAEH